MKKTKEVGPTVRDAFENSLTGLIKIDAYPYNGMELHIKDIKLELGKKNAFNVYFSELENGIPNLKVGDDPANFNPILISGTHLLSKPERSKITIGENATDEDAENLAAAKRREDEESKRSEIDEVKRTAKIEKDVAVKKAIEDTKKEASVDAGVKAAVVVSKHTAEMKLAKSADTGAVKTIKPVVK